jgi:hypothetical protein
MKNGSTYPSERSLVAEGDTATYAKHTRTIEANTTRQRIHKRLAGARRMDFGPKTILKEKIMYIRFKRTFKLFRRGSHNGGFPENTPVRNNAYSSPFIFTILKTREKTSKR